MTLPDGPPSKSESKHAKPERRDSDATLGRIKRLERLKEMQEGGVEAQLEMTSGNSTVRGRAASYDQRYN